MFESKLLQVMVATQANTFPLEWSYNRLQIIAAKRRNHLQSNNLEVLHLLASLKEQVEDDDDDDELLLWYGWPTKGV